MNAKAFRHAAATMFAALIGIGIAAGTNARPPDDAPAREAPPAPAAPRPVRLPRPAERTLPNGLRVLVIERPGTGLVSAQVLVKTGGEADPAGKAGLADMTASLLTKGAATRTAPEIAEAIEALGGSIAAGARWDASAASVGVIRSSAAPAMTLLADVVRRPRFAPAEIARLRAQTLDDLSVSLRSPGTLARYAAARVVFGDGPYGHPLGGTPESVKRLARADFVRFHATYYRPDNAVLVIGGDIPAPDAFALARARFGDWKRPAAALPALRRAAGAALSPPPPLPGRGRVVVIDKPDAGQAAVYLARAGIRRTDPDYFKAIVVNSVLGGGFSARLNQEIRIKRGLSYGASSSLDARREAGPFVAAAQCKNEAAGEVAALLRAELARLAAEPVPAAELTPRKAALTGGYARGLETTGGLVAQVASLALYGLPAGEINRFIGGVGAVGGEDVRAFARTRLSASGAHLVVVGDAKQFLGDLRRRLPEVPVEVIPVARLDLNRAVLRR